MDSPGRIVILGSGPTGLGAAWRLAERGYSDFALLEASDVPGGLARSFVDDAGFTWDVGGHVQFSHYGYYDDVLDRALGEAWLYHERESWVWIRGRFVPYPFQNNIHRLDEADRECALEGLRRARERRARPSGGTFRDWIADTFGEGLARLFLVPYNTKVWAYPPELLGANWMGERVAMPDVERIERNIELGRDDVSWGPNSLFRFPAHGGTGAIWSAVAARLPGNAIRFHSRVTGIDTTSRLVSLDEGGSVPFDTLVSSIPLDTLCRIARPLPASTIEQSARLRFSSTHVIGVGIRGGMPEALMKKCWMYFPEPHSPYYRVTVFSNYSPANVPDDGCWSLMAEVSESPMRPVDRATLVADTVDALRVDELLPEDCIIESLFHHFEPHGYPTPFVHRDDVVGPILDHLESLRIYSRGRFGAWKYEVSNQDHSFMQGVELADRLLGEGDEPTLNDPELVNGGRFLRR